MIDNACKPLQVLLHSTVGVPEAATKGETEIIRINAIRAVALATFIDRVDGDCTRLMFFDDDIGGSD